MLIKGDILQNRYHIIRQLGEGGMGAVYEAADAKRFDKPVALKEILLDLTNKHKEHFRRAFEREAKILTQVDHESVPKVIEYFLETDRQFLVMELIEGNDLDDILEKRQKAFPLENVLNWANQLLDALDYLHTLKQPIIHRDIKPQNLKLTSRGKIKLLDFGIAKDTDIEISSINTAQKTFIGATLYYSPIEQIIRIPDYFEMINSFYPEKAGILLRQAADARSDIYALGATLYHLLTNTFPIPAHKRAFDIWAGKSDTLPPPDIFNRDVSDEISAVLMKAMELERKKRFGSALEMQRALQEAVLREKWRRELEERNHWQAQQANIRREREELAAERRRLETEHEENLRELAAERRRQEREWVKNSKGQARDADTLPNVQGEQTKTEKPKFVADTLPSVTHPNLNPPLEDNFDWAQLAEKKAFMETSSPSYLDGIEFKPETPKPVADTIENVKPLTAPNFSAPTNSDRKKPLWILPVAVIGFLIFGISALGIFLLLGSSGSTGSNKAVKNPDTALPTSLPTASPTVSSTPRISNDENPKPSIAPTVTKTPAQNPVKTPALQKTQKPKTQPTKNSDCIFTGDC